MQGHDAGLHGDFTIGPPLSLLLYDNKNHSFVRKPTSGRTSGQVRSGQNVKKETLGWRGEQRQHQKCSLDESKTARGKTRSKNSRKNTRHIQSIWRSYFYPSVVVSLLLFFQHTYLACYLKRQSKDSVIRVAQGVLGMLCGH